MEYKEHFSISSNETPPIEPYLSPEELESRTGPIYELLLRETGSPKRALLAIRKLKRKRGLKGNRYLDALVKLVELKSLIDECKKLK